MSENRDTFYRLLKVQNYMWELIESGKIEEDEPLLPLKPKIKRKKKKEKI